MLQSAYRVLVSDDSVLLRNNVGNIWDSKRTSSDQSIQVKYRGASLSGAKAYFWRVMVWDKNGNVSPWSEMAQWQMGLLSREDWKGAQWIAYEKIPDTLIDVLPVDSKGINTEGDILPLMRRSFTLAKEVKQDHVYLWLGAV